MSWAALSRPAWARRAAKQGVTTRSGAPASVEAALRKVRLVATVIVAFRLFSLDETREVLSWPWLIAIACSFAAVNLVSLIGRRATGRTATILGAVQLLADTTLVLIVLWIGQDDPTRADWAIMVLPVLEGAIRFQLAGALVSWGALAIGYLGWSAVNPTPASFTDLLQRLFVVLLAALPSGYLA